MTPEGKVKTRVKNMLIEHGCWYHMPVTGGFGSSALDFICCHRGRFFSIETKAAGKKPTERQAMIAKQINRAGGVVFVIDGVNGQLEALYLYLQATA